MVARHPSLYILALLCAIAFGLCDFADAQLIASFHDEFQLTTPPVGWEYLWNSGGAIGDPTSYTALLPNAIGVYTSGGTNSLPAPGPGANVNFAFVEGAAGGHPGLGTLQSGSEGIERYAIAAFTLPEANLVSILNSNVVTTNPNSGGSTDGLNVRVFVGNSAVPAISKSTPPGVGSSVAFNGYLGVLNAGDKIYVAIGANNEDLFDSFQLSYDIVAVPEPASAMLACLSFTLLTALVPRRRPAGNCM